MTQEVVLKEFEKFKKRLMESKFAEEVTAVEIGALFEISDLINRQKSDIESLIADNKEMTKDYQLLNDVRIDDIKKAKSEAIKKFADKVFEGVAVYKFVDKTKEYIDGFTDAVNWYNGIVDNVLKEMAGVDNG